MTSNASPASAGTTSKLYRAVGGFQDDTAFVEVFSDGSSVIHTTKGTRSNRFDHGFEGPISRGDWVEVERPANVAGGAA